MRTMRHKDMKANSFRGHSGYRVVVDFTGKVVITNNRVRDILNYNFLKVIAGQTLCPLGQLTELGQTRWQGHQPSR